MCAFTMLEMEIFKTFHFKTNVLLFGIRVLQIFVTDVPEPPCCLTILSNEAAAGDEASNELVVMIDNLTVNQSLGVLGVTDEDLSDENFPFAFQIESVISPDVSALEYFR